MPYIALSRSVLPYILAKMTYVRTATPDFSVPLNRDELRVFTAIRGETSFDAVVAKTEFDYQLVKNVIAALVARGLIVPAGGNPQPQADSVASPQPSASWLEQRRAVEAFLHSRVGADKAEAYLTQLQGCTNEQAFVETTRSLAKRLALIVDADVGEQLLALLNR